MRYLAAKLSQVVRFRCSINQSLESGLLKNHPPTKSELLTYFETGLFQQLSFCLLFKSTWLLLRCSLLSCRSHLSLLCLLFLSSLSYLFRLFLAILPSSPLTLQSLSVSISLAHTDTFISIFLYLLLSLFHSSAFWFVLFWSLCLSFSFLLLVTLLNIFTFSFLFLNLTTSFTPFFFSPLSSSCSFKSHQQARVLFTILRRELIFHFQTLSSSFSVSPSLSVFLSFSAKWWMDV